MRSRLHAACCHEVDGGLCARPADHAGDHDPRISHEDGRKWTLRMVPPTGTDFDFASILKETRAFLKFARDRWPESSNPRAFVEQIDDLEARIDAVLLQQTPAPPTTAPPVRTGPPTTHVLFEGHALCGFMAGCTPSGWPDGHNWVSITEEKKRITVNNPCTRCLSLSSASSLGRSRA